MMEAKKIDLSDYLETGAGANGVSYDCKSEPEYMVKMYNEGYDLNSIYTELDTARKVFSIGVPSPEPGELVTDGVRTGIRFRRIVGKRSFSRAIADEPERVEELTREFARYCKKLHSIKCPEGLFPDAKQDFSRLIDADRVLGPEEKIRLKEFLMALPDTGTALHGDMHFGNILTTMPRGGSISEPHEVFFIDLGYFSYGYPLMDLGMTYNICNLADDEFIRHDFHFEPEVGRRAWPVFCEEYFGKGCSVEEINRMIKPFVVLKMMLVEYNLGFMPDNYTVFVKSVLEQPWEPVNIRIQ